MSNFETIKANFSKIRPEIPAISSYTGRNNTPGQRYKSIETGTGDIYLIVHPVDWRYDRKTNTHFRPEPILLIKAKEAMEELGLSRTRERFRRNKEQF